MALLTEFLDGLEKRFFRCDICHEVLNEPKQLVCFHRFCAICLERLCSFAGVESIKCPVCRVNTSKSQVIQLKTDFFTKELVDFCQQKKKSVARDRTRTCAGCGVPKWVYGYCFKCFSFLCEGCEFTHVKGHQASLLLLHNFVELTQRGFQSLDDLTRANRCKNHPELPVKYVCDTCDRCGMCALCKVDDSHIGHSYTEVAIATSKSRYNLRRELRELGTRVSEFAANVGRAQNSIQNIERRVRCLLDEMTSNEVHQSTSNSGRPTKDNERTNTKREQKTAIVDFLEGALEVLNKKDAGLDERLVAYHQRCADVRSAAKDLLSVSNDHISIRAIHSMTDIVDYVIQEGTEKFGRVGHLKFVGLMFAPSKNINCYGVIHLKGSLEASVKLKQHPRENALVCSVTSRPSGQMRSSKRHMTTHMQGGVILGSYTNDCTSYLTQVDTRGCRTQEKEFTTVCKVSRRVVRSLDRSKVVTGCYPCEVGIFDTTTGSYISCVLKESVKGWSSERWITCLAVDKCNDQIFIGSILGTEGKSQSPVTIEVLNFQLGHLRTISIPFTMSNGPIDISVAGDKIILCDLWGRNVYTVDFCGRLKARFTTPCVRGQHCAPRSVCCDSRGYVYVLWECNVQGEMSKMVMQSTIEGRPLTLRQVDSDAKCVAVFGDSENTDGMKLVVATYRRQELHIYSLL